MLASKNAFEATSRDALQLAGSALHDAQRILEPALHAAKQGFNNVNVPDNFDSLLQLLRTANPSHWSLKVANLSTTRLVPWSRTKLTDAVDPSGAGVEHIASALEAHTKTLSSQASNIGLDPRAVEAATTVVAAYARKNPLLFSLQVSGVVVAGTALLTPTIIGAAGFSTAGPVAGSAAAGWQASMGAVPAGSAFAWLQSAAMGGAAAQNVTATGVAGATAAGAATVARAVTEAPAQIVSRGIGGLAYLRGKL